jgi:hypothetical protein
MSYMSIVDPVEARRARLARTRPVARGIRSAVLLGSFSVVGVAWGVMFAEGFERADGAVQTAGIVSAIIAWPTFLLFVITMVGWRSGPIVLGLAMLLLGAGLAWARVQAGGFAEFPGWLGLLFIGLALLIWTATFAGRRDRRLRKLQEERTVTSGTEVVATVTNVPDGPNPTSSGLWGPVTFSFEDRDGTRRWVERNMLIRREGDVRVGDTTRLWYDPADPGADGRIVVELARENPLRARA